MIAVVAGGGPPSAHQYISRKGLGTSAIKPVRFKIKEQQLFSKIAARVSKSASPLYARSLRREDSSFLWSKIYRLQSL